MAEYEVKVTPTIEVDMDKLKEDVRGLSSVIEKAAKGKLRLEIDTTAAEQQLKNVKPGQVEITTKLNTRSIDSIEGEIKKRLQRVQDLADITYNFEIGNDRSEKAFQDQIRNFALIGAEYQKLLQLKDQYENASGNKKLDDAEIRELRKLETLIKSNKDLIKDLRKDFAELFNGQELKIPKVEIPVGIDEAVILTKVRKAIEDSQRTASENPINLDINLDEAKRRANNFITEIKIKWYSLMLLLFRSPLRGI